MTIPFSIDDDKQTDINISESLGNKKNNLEQRSEAKPEYSKDDQLAEVITSSSVQSIEETFSKHKEIENIRDRDKVNQWSLINIIMREYTTFTISMHFYIVNAMCSLISYLICKATEIYFDNHTSKVKVKWEEETAACYNNIKKCNDKWILKNISRKLYKLPTQITHVFPFLPQKPKYTENKQANLHVSLDYEGSRFATFATFPDRPGVFVTRLAEAGFYYQGKGDEVVCHSCGMAYRDWKQHESPSEVHMRISPDCTFVVNEIRSRLKKEEHLVSGACGSDNDKQFGNLKTNAGNGVSELTFKTEHKSVMSENEPVIMPSLAYIVLTANRNEVFTQHIAGFSRNDTTSLIGVPTDTSNIVSPDTHQGRYKYADKRMEAETSLHAPDLTKNQLTRDKDTCNSSIGVCLDKPRYEKYAIRSARLDSFRTWPRSLTQTPNEMSSAGFFFTGIEDHCRCFYCGGGLKNWEPNDRPWVEHARWYQNCAFLKQCKSEKFINDVINNGISTPNQANNSLQNASCHHDVDKDYEYRGRRAMNHPAIVSVAELGYDSETVENAFRFLTNCGEKDLTGSKLLETIFQLEDAAENIEGNQQNHTVSNLHQVSSNPNGKQSENNAKSQREKDGSELDVLLSIQSLEEENQSLRDQQTCKICLDEPIAIVFLPCGHLAACKKCAPALRRCPICRSYIKGTVKAIMC